MLFYDNDSRDFIAPGFSPGDKMKNPLPMGFSQT